MPLRLAIDLSKALRVVAPVAGLVFAVPGGSLDASLAASTHGSSHLATAPVRHELLELPPGAPLRLPYLHASRQLALPLIARQDPSSPVLAANPRSFTTSGIPNVLVNDPAGQMPGFGNTQMEPSLALHGDTLVCGFTDSQGLWTTGTLSGFATSFDGGTTWTDGGSLPLAGTGGSEMLIGDPNLASDGHGRWYYLSIYDVGNGPEPGYGDFGLALQTGSFDAGGTLVWGTPRLVAGGGYGGRLETPHMVYDAARDLLYITYTNLSWPMQWGQIEVVTLGSGGTQVLHSVVVQPESFQNNAGPSLALGPNGELYVAWEQGFLGGLGQGPANQVLSCSLDQGATFSTAVSAATVIECFFNGPPGFNREGVFCEFPRIAVDRSDGPNRGRVYLAWHEAVLMDFTGTLTQVTEMSGNNETPQTAQVLPSDTSHWQIDGSISASGDYHDWYRFSGAAGEHVRMILYFNAYMKAHLRLRCADGTGAGADTILAQSLRGTLDPVFFIFSLPTTGDYYVEIERSTGSGSYTGYLRKTQSTTPAAAHDHRDIVVVSSSDGGASWSQKVRVNDDTGFTDQALPTAAVDGCGGLHVSWYDRRFDPHCRALADVLMASSFDGGQTFTPNVRLTSVSSWWQVVSDAIPNFGDYFLATADGERLFVPWADGRLGDPDVRIAALRMGMQVEAPALVRARVSQPLEVPVQVHNGGPYDASVQIEMHSTCSELPDTTWTIPVPAGGDSSGTYTAVIGEWIRYATPCSLFVTVTSPYSACTTRDTVLVINDAVAVTLRDFSAETEGADVRLRWRAEGGMRFDVERAALGAAGGRGGGPDGDPGPGANSGGGDPGLPQAEFVPLVRALGAGRGGSLFEWVDRGAGAGRWAYRLVGHEPGGGSTLFGPWVVETGVPPRLALRGAQPNPFNPGTRLRFELPRAASVTLRILDVRGRLVATLLQSAPRPAGVQALPWDGRNAAGELQASGIYFAELTALGEKRSARLVLLR